MSTEISNDIKAKYGDSNGTFAASDLGLILTELSEVKPTKSEILEAIKGLKGNVIDGRLSFNDFTKWSKRTYCYTSGGILNRLLLRYPLGKGRRSGYDLPPQNHVYGKMMTPDLEGAGKVVNGWKLSTPSPDPKQYKDLVVLNKLATMDGCTNASSVRAFQKEHEILQRTHAVAVKGASSLPKKYIGSTFGEPSRPSTPVKTLMQSKFDKEGENDYPSIERKRHTTPEIRSTRAARGQDVRFVGLTDEKITNSTKEPFKLKKFSKITSRVNSNNSTVSSKNNNNKSINNQASEV